MCRFTLLSACSNFKFYLDIVVYKQFNMPVDICWVGFSGSHVAIIDYNTNNLRWYILDHHQLRPTRAAPVRLSIQARGYV